ncbi:Lrp/AsnC ligand binding domain-containing protein [Staphylothermus hellenicus]|uniref:Transcriptional regulator, AsnC family n=1 Tax=Staphylothermus hellenicus (strain DSM 12710 / JCM 10830 / BK20S6-10-b1 / P8) TaxID=591019 RepID=D7DA04_STAHD|nr:Lrp/AsnC ligand binding domain-containing protein [Staphylothermus hellenicus]ADI32600.1 transcriptional regulator, AsnC family [Staphylothermus hellenicus DSM 12710]
MAKAGAIVLIQTDIGAESRVMEELVKVPEITEAYIVYGIYDIIVKIEAESLEKIREVITNRIRKLPDIRTTSTMVIVEERIKKQ